MMMKSSTPFFSVVLLLLSLQQFTNGQVLINEVAVTGVVNVCAGADYIELINTGGISNTGGASMNLSGFVLHDISGPTGEDAFTLPPQFVMAPNETRLFCRNQLGSFRFGIEDTDIISLSSPNGTVFSTTGIIAGAGSSTSTYNRFTNGTYGFAAPTPGTINGVTPTVGKPIINEVAIIGTSNSSTIPCFGGPYIELFNDAFAAVNLTGYSLTSGSSMYAFTNQTISRFAFFTLCTSGIFLFSPNGTIMLMDPAAAMVSSTGPIGGSNPRTPVIDSTWTRVTDFIITSAPFTPFYQYSLNPTPNARNTFSFIPQQLPIQACGNQTAPLSMVSDYVLKSITNLNVNGGDPELSGGTFDPRTCNHIVVGDGALMHEIAIAGSTATLIRARPLIGGSRTSNTFGTIPDSEGVCFYRDPINGDKIAILDERDRSVHICDIPLASQLVPLFRDSPNCRVVKLSPEQVANTSLANPDGNGSFEAIACDPANGKLYIGNEVAPMLIWSVDYTSGKYDVLIDVQRLPAWTSKIISISGMAYDPLSKNLYVLSALSKVILQSTLNGTLIGGQLNVSAVGDPGGLSYEPTTGDLLVFGEPREVARYSKRASTKSPTNAPVRPPTNPPVRPPTNPPVRPPTKAPTRKPTKAPTKAPTLPPCGLFGLSIFCPLTFCGFLGRLLGLCTYFV